MVKLALEGLALNVGNVSKIKCSFRNHNDNK
jgi:hypothetical protein